MAMLVSASSVTIAAPAPLPMFSASSETEFTIWQGLPIFSRRLAINDASRPVGARTRVHVSRDVVSFTEIRRILLDRRTRERRVPGKDAFELPQWRPDPDAT